VSVLSASVWHSATAPQTLTKRIPQIKIAGSA
jgi:hypothetical protein